MTSRAVRRYPGVVDGFVAVTDPGWYEHLRRRSSPCDANFWRPSIRRFNLAPWTPFFFKLKAPHHAIAGFGYFAGFSVLPDWLAWDTFGDANGVQDLDALRARLRRIRDGARIEANPLGQIGCCLIAEATFFAPDAWVVPPDTWSPRRARSRLRCSTVHPYRCSGCSPCSSLSFTSSPCTLIFRGSVSHSMLAGRGSRR